MTTWKKDASGMSASTSLGNGLIESRQLSAIPPEDTILAADPIPNPAIDLIKAQLDALDIKRIRPTAEGDAAYLATLNVQAVALRAQLSGLPLTIQP